MNKKEFKNFIKKIIKENFASQEFYDKEKSDVLNYLENESGWVTVLLDPSYQTIKIFKDVVGLDPQRDNIDEDEMDNYMELSVEEVMGLLDEWQPLLVDMELDESSSLSQTNKRGKNLKPVSLNNENVYKKIKSIIKEALENEFNNNPPLMKINKDEAEKLFYKGKVIYIKNEPYAPDSSVNTFMLRKDLWDGSMNIYKDYKTPEEYGFDNIINWLEEKSEYPLEYFTFDSTELFQIDSDTEVV
jgi:hypothetical protein